MAVKQNAEQLTREEFPLASQAVQHSFYIDDGLTGADDVQQQLQEKRSSNLKFKLRKWNSNEASVMATVPEELKETNKSVNISGLDHQLAKTLGIEIRTDSFLVSVSPFHSSDELTKRNLPSGNYCQMSPKSLRSSDGWLPLSLL